MRGAELLTDGTEHRIGRCAHAPCIPVEVGDAQAIGHPQVVLRARNRAGRDDRRGGSHRDEELVVGAARDAAECARGVLRLTQVRGTTHDVRDGVGVAA